VALVRKQAEQLMVFHQIKEFLMVVVRVPLAALQLEMV
jgi:hypothetical protein